MTENTFREILHEQLSCLMDPRAKAVFGGRVCIPLDGFSRLSSTEGLYFIQAKPNRTPQPEVWNGTLRNGDSMPARASDSRNQRRATAPTATAHCLDAGFQVRLGVAWHSLPC
jgi:hypothetical protein